MPIYGHTRVGFVCISAKDLGEKSWKHRLVACSRYSTHKISYKCVFYVRYFGHVGLSSMISNIIIITIVTIISIITIIIYLYQGYYAQFAKNSLFASTRICTMVLNNYGMQMDHKLRVASVKYYYMLYVRLTACIMN